MKNKTVLFFIGLIIFASAATICAEDDNDLAKVYYQSGLSLFKQDKYNDAVEKFNKALSYRREFPEVLFKLGECYEKLADNKSSLQNYRLCQKYLKQQKSPSKEENELLAQVSRCISKLDIGGNEFRKIKNDYLSGLLAAADDCLKRKWQRFTFRLAQSVLEIDEANKSAQALLAKLDKKITAVQSSDQLDAGPARELFNGKDIKNWGQGSSEDTDEVFWNVTGGRIIGDPKNPKLNTALLCLDKTPDKYILTIKASVLKYYREPSRAVILIMHGKTDRGGYAGNPVMLSRFTNGENELKIIRYTDRAKVTVNGKNVPNNEEELKSALLSIVTPRVGIGIIGAAISIKKITIQEFKEPAASKTGDAPEISPGKKPAAAKKGLTRELFNGKNLANWTSASSDASETECWVIKAGKITLNTKKPGTDANLLWKDPPPKNYKLTVAFNIGGACVKDKFSAMGFIYGKAGSACDALSFYSGQAMPESCKLEVVKNGNSYQLSLNGQSGNEFSGTAKPPAIGFFTQNTILSISSITLEEIRDSKTDEK